MMFHAILYLVAVTLASGAALAWFEPSVTRWVILKLSARAAGLEAARAAYKAAHRKVYEEAAQ